MTERYTLQVKHPDTGAWHSLDLSEAPITTLQVNDLGEAADRNASFTQKLSIPRSNANAAALGAVDVFESECLAAYDPREAVLLLDGRYLFPPGSRLYVDKITNNAIETQIVAGVFDLFTALGANTQPLGASGSFMYDAATIAEAATPTPSPSRAMLAAFAAVKTPDVYGLGFLPVGDIGGAESSYGFPLGVQFVDYIRKTLAWHGYTLETDIEQTAAGDYLVVTPPPQAPEQEVAKVRLFALGLVWGTPDDDLGALRLEGIETDEAGLFRRASLRTFAVDPGVYRIAVTAPFIEPNNDLAVYARTVSGYDGHTGELKLIGRVGTSDPDGATFTATLGVLDFVDRGGGPFGGGDFVEMVVTAVQGSSPDILDFTLERLAGLDGLPDEESGEAPEPSVVVGKTFDVYSAVGFETQAEAVKAFVQYYGLTLDVVHRQTGELPPYEGAQAPRGVVRAYSLGELYRRRAEGRFVDWSLLLDIGAEDNAFGFRVGSYAQSNTIAYAEGADGTTSTASFAVADKSLAATRTILTLPFETPAADYDGLAVGNSVTIEEGETEADTATGTNYTLLVGDEVKPQIVRLGTDTVTTAIVQGDAINNQLGLSLRVASQLLAPDAVANYSGLVELLDKARTVTARFALSAADVADFDFMTPVYIEYFGAFFYVAKINNFVVNEPTQVELVRL